MKKISFLIVALIISSFNIHSQTDMSQTVHQYLLYQSVKLLAMKNPAVINSNPEFFTLLGAGNNWEDWNNSDFDWHFPYMKGSMYTGAFREDEEDVIDNICGGLFSPGCITISHFWEGDEGDDAPLPEIWPFSCESENALRKIRKLWFGNYTEGISIGHVYPNNSHLTFKVRFGQNGYENLATAYNNIRNNNWDYLFVTKDRVRYDKCDPDGFSDINQNIYSYLSSKGFNDVEIKAKAKAIIFETLGRICHLLADMGVSAHANNRIHTRYDRYEAFLSDFFNDPQYKITWDSPSIYEKGIININAIYDPIKGITYLLNQVADRFPCDCYNIDPLPNYYRDGDLNWLDNATPYLNMPFYQNNIPTFYASVTDVALNENISFETSVKIHNHTFPIIIRSLAGFIDFFLKNTTYAIPEPDILNIYQNPIVITQGTTGTITCNLINGQDPLDYVWEWIDLDPDGHSGKSFSGYYNKCKVTWHNSIEKTESLYKSDPKWKLRVQVRRKNSTNYDYITICPNFTPPPPVGCPWLSYSDSDTNSSFDNNILHKSQLPENIGNFITDKYVLNSKPGVFDGKITVSLVETSIDSTVINSVKLYAIDHPVGSKLGISENNTVVMFDSASTIETFNASLFDPENNYADITENVLYHHPPKITVNGDSLYHIYAEFRNTALNNPAIISYLYRGIYNPIYPIVKDSYSGLITGNTPSGSFQYPFMRRENPDIIITPLNQANSVDSVHIAWDKNFKIRYVAITSIRNTGFVSTELPLISAYHTNDGDVFSSLFQTDSLYTYINPNSYIILDFQNIENPGSGGTRDYIFEVNGKVIFLGNTEIKQNLLSTIKNEDKLEYKLSQNYPNPFNPVTKINFALPKQGFATLKVYDILGREVRILVNEMKQAGSYSVDFDASHLSSGIYFYRLESGSFSNVKKMILIK